MYLLLLLYVAARILQPFVGKVPTLLIVVLHVLPPAAFAFLHGRTVYRTRGILVFMAVCLGVGAFFESLSLRTGFPFGSYYFSDLMGPKVFQLPALLVLAYVGMGYVSWVVGLLILGSLTRTLSGRQVVLLPVGASFVMVAWDLAMDPVWTNIDHAWGVEEWRGILRRARDQFLRLVSHDLCHLSGIRHLSAKAGGPITAAGILAPARSVLWSVSGWESPACNPIEHGDHRYQFQLDVLRHSRGLRAGFVLCHGAVHSDRLDSAG
jgi:hypothetical protein